MFQSRISTGSASVEVREKVGVTGMERSKQHDSQPEMRPSR